MGLVALARPMARAAPGLPIDDVEEVSNYVAAMQHGLRRLRRLFVRVQSHMAEVPAKPWFEERP